MKLIKEIEKSTALETLSKCDMHHIHNALFDICDNAHVLPFDFDAKLQGVVDENEVSPIVVDMKNSLLIWGSIEIDIESVDVRLFVFIDEDDKKFMHIYTGIHGSRVNMNGVPFRPSLRHLDFAITDDVYEALVSETAFKHEIRRWNLLTIQLKTPDKWDFSKVAEYIHDVISGAYGVFFDRDIEVDYPPSMMKGIYNIKIEIDPENEVSKDFIDRFNPKMFKQRFNTTDNDGVVMLDVKMLGFSEERG